MRDVRDDESESSGHSIGHRAQIGSRAVARLENAVLLQSVQRETNGCAGDLETPDEHLFARELFVLGELSVQDLAPQGCEDLDCHTWLGGLLVRFHCGEL